MRVFPQRWWYLGVGAVLGLMIGAGLAARITDSDTGSTLGGGGLGAIAGTEDGEALLDRLVDAGLFEAPNVQAAVIDQVFATVGDLVTWHDGWSLPSFSISTAR